MPVVPLLVVVSDLFKINCGFSLFTYKSEGNISSIELAPSLNGSQWPEFLCSNHTGQEHTMEAVVVQNSTDQIAANINIYY